MDENLSILTLDWSDGVTTWQDGANGPTDDMLDKTPEVNGDQDYFRLVERGSAKEVQWLQKLAMWLVETKDPELFQGRKFAFAELPAGYRLFEHIRTPGARSSIKARTDTYLYGHPKGPRKRYRSIVEFKQHLLWLASDETRNPKNCECRICCGKAEAPAEPVIDHSVQASAANTRNSAAKERAAAAVQTAPTRTKVTRRTAANAALAVAAPAPAAPTAPRRSTSAALNSRSTSSTPAPTLPTAVPFPVHYMSSSFTAVERALDAAPAKDIFRPGELVWCHCTEAWSLGVIIARPRPESPGYTVQVLKSPLESEMSKPYPGITLSGLRPWLAWSTPEITIPALRNVMEFESINWDQFRIVRGLEVDASIIKSRDIDTSYCLVDKIDYPHANFYAGVFYGAEKIWMGEIVRLKRHAVPQANLTGLEIMVVVSIQDHRQQHLPAKTRKLSTDITVMGDVYEFVSYPKSTVPVPQIPPWLPARLIKETKLKNQVTSHATGNPTVGTWRCIQHGYSVKLEDIKGRWYESSILIPELKGHPKFHQDIQNGKWDELATQMNEMGNAGQASVRGWLRNSRRDEALTKAVPRGFVLEKDPLNQGVQQGYHLHGAQQHQQREMVDLTSDDDNGDYVPQGDHRPTGEFLDDGDDGDDEALTRQMEADVASFFRTEPVDSFYGSL